MKSFLGNFYRHLAIFFWSHWSGAALRYSFLTRKRKSSPVVFPVIEQQEQQLQKIKFYDFWKISFDVLETAVRDVVDVDDNDDDGNQVR